MSFVIVRDSLVSQLANAESPLEICTADGVLLGYFTPVKARTLAIDPGISEEELNRRFSQGGGRPLSDILADLEKRA